ncbi:MAG: translation initiation factor IF-2 [Candidatus Omnitrophota bacterium]
MSIKVSILAKELGVSAEKILDQLHKLYVEVKNQNSKIDDKVAALVRIKMGGAKKAKTISGKAGVKTKTAAKIKPALLKKPAAAAKTSKKEKTAKKETAKPVKTILEAKKPGKKKPATSSKVKAKVSTAPKKEENPPVSKPPGVEIIRKVAPAERTARFQSKKTKPFRRTIEVIEKGAKYQGGSRIHKRTAGKAKGETPDAGQPSARKTLQKVQIHVPVNIRTLAPRINVKPNIVIQYLMQKGALININQDLDEEVVRDIMAHFGYELELPRTMETIEKELMQEHHGEQKTTGEVKPPVVTFMGHVDHGKTSLLDYIRKTMVTKGEKGGITQHIGAYKVETPNGSVTFLDTPGHAAFTAMRARGAHATDVVVLVVAADDGVMPQTKEAIDHARAANVPIVVAINKCDVPGANPGRVRKELQKENLVAEDWGGKTVMAEVSAITGEGVDHLVEMLMLESEMLELKANPKLRARGVVIESKKTPGRGVAITLLVQNGTLYLGDIVLCGAYYGKIKAMTNDTGNPVKDAFPSTPVEVLGLQGIPEAGEEFFVVKDEKKARILAVLKQNEKRTKHMGGNKRVTLEDLHNRIVEGGMKELKMILKADVQGSVGALETSLEELATDEVKLKIVHSAVGEINESDIMLAAVSDAVVIGFHVKVNPKAEEVAAREKIDVRVYDIIYEAIADVRAGMEGLLEPEEREIFQGSAQVKEVFSASKVGKAAGCSVIKGTIHRKDNIRIKRGQEVVFEGQISSLKRFKDDVKEVKTGFECGISLRGFNNIRKNDVLEAFIIEKVARRLEK